MDENTAKFAYIHLWSPLIKQKPLIHFKLAEISDSISMFCCLYKISYIAPN